MSETKPTVGEQLAVINTKLDVLLAGKDDHEARIRVLEQTRHASLGKASAVSFVIALVPTILWAVQVFR